MATDPDFANVVLLSGFEGTDGSTTFVDESSYARTLVAEGDAQVDTAQFKYGAASAEFDGTGDSISTAVVSELHMGSQDFTIEMFVRFNGDPSGTDQVPASHYNNVGDQKAWYIRLPTSNTIEFVYSTSGSSTDIMSRTYNPPGDTWVHLAFVRNGSDLYIFVDGTQAGATGTITGSLHVSTADPRISGLESGGLGRILDAWVDEFRWTIGTARYTSDFTPPTEAFPREGPPVSAANSTKFVGYAAYQPASDFSVSSKKVTGYSVYEPEHDFAVSSEKMAAYVVLEPITAVPLAASGGFTQDLRIDVLVQDLRIATLTERLIQ